MKWLSRTLAGLLVATICSVILTSVFNATLFSSHYIEHKAAATNSYVRLSSALSTELAKNMGPNTPPQATETLKSILTPQVLQQKINGALDGLSAYYKGNSAPPTIDLTGLAAQVQAAGLPLSGNNNPLTKPITLPANANARSLTHRFTGLRLSTIALLIVLIGALLFVSWERHRYAVLPDIATATGILIGVLAIILKILPGVINHHIKFDFSSNAFASIAHDLVISIVQSLSSIFGIIAIIFLVVGITTRVLVAKLNLGSPTGKPVQSKPLPAAKK